MLTDDDFSAAVSALGSNDVLARDDAAARLEIGGWSAALRLLEAARELSSTAKARALFTFVALTYTEQSRRVRNPPQPIHIGVRGKASEVAAAMHELLGLEIRVDPELCELPIALDHTCASPMAALDLLANDLGARWQQDPFGVVRLIAGSEPAVPTAYAGDLRICVVNAQTTRRSNFRDHDVSVEYGVEVSIERPLLPLRAFALHHIEALDLHGRRLPTTASMRFDDDHLARFSLTLTDLPLECRRLDRLRVVVDTLFPDTHEVLRLVELRAGARLAGALCEVEVITVRSDSIRLISRPSASAEPFPVAILARIIDAAFLAIADDEEELAATESFRPAGVEDEVHWELRWTRLPTARIREVRLRAVRSLWLRSTPFELHDLPIP